MAALVSATDKKDSTPIVYARPELSRGGRRRLAEILIHANLQLVEWIMAVGELEPPIKVSPSSVAAGANCRRLAGLLDRTDNGVDFAGQAHGPGFTWVRWNGVRHRFGGLKQRIVVETLWRSWQAGEEYVMGACLMECADSDGDRVRDLFRRHPAWGTMIQWHTHFDGPPGSYRLAAEYVAPGG